jgi:8-oxo-dGTP pyrophosphatase MutT (NUDIX family)
MPGKAPTVGARGPWSQHDSSTIVWWRALKTLDVSGDVSVATKLGLDAVMNWERANKRAAGVVVVRRWPQGWRVLILRAYRNWDFPKGLLDPGESPLAAALRETREETGLANLVFNWGHGFTDTEPYAVGKVVRYFLAESPAGEVVLPVSAELGRPEHDEFRWTTPEDAAALLPPRLVTILRWAQAQLGAPG